jgi:hypothetical protein
MRGPGGLVLGIALLVGAATVASVSAHADGAPAAALRFDHDTAEFGERYQHEVVTRTLTFENRGPNPLTVLEAVALAGDARLRVEPASIPPGGRGALHVEQPLGARLGRVAFRYRLRTDEPGEGRYRLGLSGFVQSAYDPETLVLDFRSVAREQGASSEFELASREIERLELAGAEDDLGLVDVAESGRTGSHGEGLRLRARLRPGAPEGWVSGTVRLRTNVAHQPALTLSWRAVVFGDVRPAENPVRLGLVELGQVASRRIELRSASGSPVMVTRLVAEGPLAATSTDCGPACAAVELQLGGAPPGPLAGQVVVHLDRGGPITLRYSGVAVAPGTRIKRVVIDPDAETPPDATDPER